MWASPVYEQLPIPGSHFRNGGIPSSHGVTSWNASYDRSESRSNRVGGANSGHCRLLDRGSEEGRIGGVVQQVVLAEQTVKLLNRERIVRPLERKQ